jgi:hypothetical protein
MTIDQPLLKFLDLKKYNAVIAGGAARLWHSGMDIGSHDIDIWFKDESDLQKMQSCFYDKSFSPRIVTEFAVTYMGVEINDKYYNIQLIKKYNKEIIDLFDSFDITVCKIATDGEQWWFGDNYLEHVQNKVLHFESCNSNSLRRLFKYASYGFCLDQESIQKLSNFPNLILDYSSSGANHDDYGF